MSRVVADVVVERPAQDVFAYATDPTTFHEWQKGVVVGPAEAGQPQQVGSTCVTTRRIGLAERSIASEITELEPPHRWVSQGLEGPVRARVQVDVEALDDDRSHLTISIDFTGHGIGKLIVPLFVVREARKEMPDNLAVLRRRMTEPKVR